MHLLPQSLRVAENQSSFSPFTAFRSCEILYFRIYHELIHLKSCKSSCLVAFRSLYHDQTDIDCRWFHDLLEHARGCNPSLCSVCFFAFSPLTLRTPTAPSFARLLHIFSSATRLLAFSATLRNIITSSRRHSTGIDAISLLPTLS